MAIEITGVHVRVEQVRRGKSGAAVDQAVHDQASRTGEDCEVVALVVDAKQGPAFYQRLREMAAEMRREIG